MSCQKATELKETSFNRREQRKRSFFDASLFSLLLPVKTIFIRSPNIWCLGASKSPCSRITVSKKLRKLRKRLSIVVRMIRRLLNCDFLLRALRELLSWWNISLEFKPDTSKHPSPHHSSRGAWLDVRLERHWPFK